MIKKSKSTAKTGAKSQRQLQVGEQIKRIIAEIFMRNGLSTISGSYITILEADISPDMKNCKVFIDIFGKKENSAEILQKLNAAAPNLRHELGKKLTMRGAPELKFFLDDSSQHAIDIDSLIAEEAKKFDE